jgi:ELWxxDGT repeat protein
MTVVGNEVIFNGADDEDTPGSLWETNGTAAGTVEIGGEGNAGIADAPAGFTGPFTSELALGMQPNDITAFDGEAIFAAFDSTIDSAGYYADADTLWMTNGTASGTVEIGGAQNAGIAGANPALDGGIFWGGSIEYPDFTVYDGKALFVGYDAAGHAGLWETDGTAAGTVEIGGLGGAGIAGGLSLLDSQTPDFTVYNGEVYFIGYNASNQAGLWVTNGTAAGTYEVDAGYPSAPLGVASLSDDYVGGGQVNEINGAGGGEVILFDTGGNVDKVFGSNGTVDLVSAQASVIGQNDVILFQGGTGNQVKLFNTNGEDDKVFGSSEIAYVVDAQAKFIGGDDSIRCSGSGDAVKLFSTAGQLDKVFGFNLNVGVVSAQASIIDGDDTIHCSGTGDEVKLFATIGEYDKVFGAGVNAYLINAQASFIQGGDTIHLLNGQDDSIKLFATGSDADTVDGANGTIFVIGAEVSVTGSGSSIRMFDNDTVSVSGTSEAFVFQPAIGEDVINGFGSSDTMQFSASDFANFTALQTHMSKSGANTVITLDANDTVTLDNVAMSSLTASQFKFA